MSARIFTRDELGEIDTRPFAGHAVVAVVPLTDDVQWAAETTWMLARGLASTTRRIALLDLSLDRPALDVGAAQPVDEGIVDAFLYGASLSRIAKTQGEKSLYYIGVGTRTTETESVWANPRWRPLAKGFASEGALLLPFLPPHALDKCALRPDGFVVIATGAIDLDDPACAALADRVRNGVPIIAVVADPQASPSLAQAHPPVIPVPIQVRNEEEEKDDEEEEAETVEVASVPRDGYTSPPLPPLSAEPSQASAHPQAGSLATKEVRPKRVRRKMGRGNKLFLWATTFVGIGLVVAAGVMWPREDQPTIPLAETPDSADTAVPETLAINAVDSAAPVISDTDSSQLTDTAGSIESALATPTPSAVFDSLYFSVQIASLNTPGRGIEYGERVTNGELVVSVTPVLVGGSRVWHRVIIGAFPTQAAADSVKQALWTSGSVPRGEGTVVRTPYALSLGIRTDAEQANLEVQGLRDRGIPAYVLSAPDGAQILVGAFGTPNQASTTEALLAQSGLSATRVPRMGIRR